MRIVGIKTLKNDLSKYIRAAAAGETVIVTDRNRIVAQIVQAGDITGVTEAERNWAELERSGVARLATIPPSAPLPHRQAPLMTMEELMRDLDESRSDR